MGALAPAILGQSLLPPPFSTRNFGTIYYYEHSQFKSPKYASAVRVFWGFFEPPTHLLKDIFTI